MKSFVLLAFLSIAILFIVTKNKTQKHTVYDTTIYAKPNVHFYGASWCPASNSYLKQVIVPLLQDSFINQKYDFELIYPQRDSVKLSSRLPSNIKANLVFYPSSIQLFDRKNIKDIIHSKNIINDSILDLSFQFGVPIILIINEQKVILQDGLELDSINAKKNLLKLLDH